MPGVSIFGPMDAHARGGVTLEKDGASPAGPNLYGVFGRKAGAGAGYEFSDAMKNSGIVWDEATFREYIKGPKAKVPGTKMDFPGLKTDKEIDDIVVFLGQFAVDGKKK